MGKIIAIIQEKGGGEKTTNSINILGAMLEKRYKCVLCDMDKAKPDAIFWAGNGSDLKNYVVPMFEDNPTEAINLLKTQNDYVIIDTPPNFEKAALKAALLADLIIIPCAPSLLDRRGLEQSTNCAMMVEKPYRFLASRVKLNTNVAKRLMAELEETGRAFSTVIPDSITVVEAQNAGTWVGKYAPNSKPHILYKNLVSEIKKALKGKTHE